MKKHFLKKVTSEAPRSRQQARQEGGRRARGLLMETEGGCAMSLWLWLKQIRLRISDFKTQLHSRLCSLIWGFSQIPELPWPGCPQMFRNLTPPSEQRELGVKLPALEKMNAYTVIWALSFRSHICHFLALNIMSHIPDSSHHPKKCVLSRIDVPYLWTQPSLLYILLETGIESSCCESHSHCLHGPFSQQGHAGTWRRRMPGSRLASSYWKSIWLRHFTWLLQFLSSLPMCQSDPSHLIVCRMPVI